MRSFVAILFLLPLASWCQTMHNASSIFIPKGVDVSLVDVNNTGFIMNNGSMFVYGNWTNTKVYQGSGQIALAGNDQFIANNEQSIEKLLITGGGKKRFDSNITIKDKLTLTYGIIRFGTNGKLTLDNEATVEGGSSGSFVNGAITSNGTGYKFFPVGVGENYYPVWFNEVRGLTPVIEVQAHINIPAIKTTTPVQLTNDVYWTSREVEGQFKGSTVTAVVQSVPSDRNRVVFVQGGSAYDEFAIVNNEAIFSEGGMAVASSESAIDKRMFTIATLPEQPVRPGYLSTTLSPNAANIVNRAVRMQGLDLIDDGFFFEVYNRWGNQLFESRSLSDMASTGWDGKQQGQLLPSGAYPFRVVYKDRTGKETQQTGFITIVY